MKEFRRLNVVLVTAFCLSAMACSDESSFSKLDVEDDDDSGNTATQTVTYCPQAALGEDPYVRYFAGHAITIEFDGLNKMFFDRGATFVENLDNGTARLTGVARQRNAPSKAFNVDVSFTGRTSSAPSGSPKLELWNLAYVANGGIVDPSTWHYYTDTFGTFTGIEDLAGKNLVIERIGPAFQVGRGANGKNANYGASGWLSYDGDGCAPGVGDFNIDLNECPCPGSIPPIGV